MQGPARGGCRRPDHATEDRGPAATAYAENIQILSGSGVFFFEPYFANPTELSYGGQIACVASNRAGKGALISCFVPEISIK